MELKNLKMLVRKSSKNGRNYFIVRDRDSDETIGITPFEYIEKVIEGFQ